ncbi:histidine phosphatase family protein [Alkalicoccus luteus]|uniref:Histidine phosphatase family protein n=1 Tax=Alkalicoccus luteus TaxID=1237094 RepID=A0A969PRM5_9BACI|nr:histidine phosphatase family protein [Alkalicoccus luteus]NJP39132.1 histidine phosphatase family protein [Alkalicoccus luteus]
MDTNRTIHLDIVRHGVTEANLAKQYLGWTDEPVSSQAKKTLEELKELLGAADWQEVHASDLLRCRQTAEALELTPQFDERLREMHFGEWEMHTYEQLKHLSAYRSWVDDPVTRRPPGGESWNDLKERVAGWYTDMLEREPERVVAVTHGGVIRTLLMLTGAAEHLWQYKVRHGGAFRLTLSRQKEGWICTSLSAVPTLEKGSMPLEATPKQNG